MPDRENLSAASARQETMRHVGGRAGAWCAAQIERSLRRRFLEEAVTRGWSLSEARRLERLAKNPDGEAYLWLPGYRPVTR